MAQQLADIDGLLQLVGAGRIDEVRAMLDANPSLVNGIGAHPFWGGRPQPLHVAIETGREPMVALLLDRGADINGVNDQYDGWSPLMLAMNRDRAAIRQDFVGFARSELAHRKSVGLPPFARMVRIVLRDQEEEKLFKHSEQLAADVREAAAAEGPDAAAAVAIKGPMPCAINRIAGYFRNQLVMSSPDPQRLQRILARVREKGGLARTERIAVDVDPVSLL